ncbi:MAG: zinc ribbon domain-containing protein [Steroidobacteraceae bacterium]
MPIYEYQCAKCGHHLEALQKLSDKPLRECPECGKHSLTRLMSAPLFRLAGSGWYETDFKSDKETKRNLLEKGDAEPAKTEAKADVKPVAKPVAEAVKPASSVTRPAAKRAAKAAARPKARTPARNAKPARGKKR